MMIGGCGGGWLLLIEGRAHHRSVQFRETKAPTFPSCWVDWVWDEPTAAAAAEAEVVNGPIMCPPTSGSYRETTTGVRPDSWPGVTTCRAVVRPVPVVELSVPFSVSPVPPAVEIAFTKVSFPPGPVVARYRGSAVAPFVPAGRMFSSAPPGSRASSGVMVAVGEPPLLYPALEDVLMTVLPLLPDPAPADELMRSLCSWAPVIVWMWVGCCV